jgi:hypothetical protein
MIRTRRLPPALLDAWLVNQGLPTPHASYHLRLWVESRAALPSLLVELRQYIDEALDDARQRLRRGFEDALSPFNDPATDPAANYPAVLNRITLQGYFGETLAVLAVEHWGAIGHADWVVPALLFRLHDTEFQHLELINQRRRDGLAHDPDAVANRRPGRTGDDALAFRMNDAGIITDVLTLEAKCLSQNNNATIKEAHGKLVAGGSPPPGVRELISLLEEYTTPGANAWHEALLRLWLDGYRTAAKHDGVSYATAHVPVRGGRRTWMPGDKPHPAYTLNRRLDGMEFQFEDLDQLIDSLYRSA